MKKEILYTKKLTENPFYIQGYETGSKHCQQHYEELLDQQKTEIDSIITERMKQIANIPFYKRKNSYDELKELRKKLKNKK
jgi:hypothetical protein